MGFFAMLLGNILFLTDVWGYSILRAGLAVTPGPLVVAFVPGRRARSRARRLPSCARARFGLLCGRPAVVRDAGRRAARPTSRQWLPGTLLVGLGIGLTFPVVSAAAYRVCPPIASRRLGRQPNGASGRRRDWSRAARGAHRIRTSARRSTRWVRRSCGRSPPTAGTGAPESSDRSSPGRPSTSRRRWSSSRTRCSSSRPTDSDSP